MHRYSYPAILFIATLMIFSPLLRGGFDFLASWDDPTNILQDPMVKDGSLEVWSSAWQTVRLGVYEPCSIILKATIVWLFGLKVQAFQNATLVLHLLNVGLVFVIARRLLRRSQAVLQLDLRPEAGAALGAAFFALHPLRVEVVAWASGQPYALAACFFLLSTLIYLQYCERIQDRRDDLTSWALLTLSVVTYCLAVTSKSSAIFLPAALLALDRFPMQRKWSVRLLCEKLPFLAAAASFAFAALSATASSEKINPFSLELPAKIAYAFHSFAFHLGKSVWPVALSPHYALPDRDVTPLSFPLVLSVLGVIAFCIFAWSARRRAPWLGTAWWIYLAGMLPVSGLLGHGHLTLGADRYAYMPLIGVAIVAGGFLTSKRVMPDPAFSSWNGRVVVAGLATALFALATTTLVQLEHWRNDESLWRAAVDSQPHNPLVLNNLGYLYFAQGRIEQAMSLLIRAREIEPSNLRATLSLGVLYQKLGRNREATQLYRAGLEHHPENPSIHSNLSVAYDDLGKKARGAKHARLAAKYRNQASSQAATKLK